MVEHTREDEEQVHSTPKAPDAGAPVPWSPEQATTERVTERDPDAEDVSDASKD